MKTRTRLVAIVGGSGSGKSWLASQLQERLGQTATRICLDDFYRDQSHLSPGRRSRINFDHPRAIDRPAFEEVLRRCRQGHPFQVPNYDFKTHTRTGLSAPHTPGEFLLIDGLWLFRRPSVRILIDLRVFIDCPESTRLNRRLERDTLHRGRTDASVRDQFQNLVAPMHDRFVAPQKNRADVVLESPIREEQLRELIKTVRALQTTDAKP